MRILIHDPAGVSERQLVVTPALFFIVSLFNGEATVRDIQAAYTRRFGELIMGDKITDIIRQFDEALFLESGRFREHVEKQAADFKALKVRPLSHAGRAFPADAEEVRKEFEGYFTDRRGPGAVGERTDRRCLGIIAPHFDLRNGGGIASAHAYKALAESACAETVLVIGVNHGPGANLYPATNKDFATPLGTVSADREFIEALAEFYDGDLFEDEFAHRNEHSLEFQAVFLAYARPEVKIVPVLASGFHGMLDAGEKPSGNRQVNSFIEAVSKAREKTGRDITLVAGVDLAHVGPKFGGAPVADSTLAQVEAEDRAMLEIIASGDAEAFDENIRSEGDRRNVCGYPAIYTFLRILGGAKGELLYYAQTFEDPTRSMVSFASMVF